VLDIIPIDHGFEPIEEDHRLTYKKEEFKPFSTPSANDVIEDTQIEIAKERFQAWSLKFMFNYLFGGKTMYEKIITNWKTTLAGIVGSLAVLLMNTWASGQPITGKTILGAAIPLVVGALAGDEHKKAE
jgi:hypothetical protein